MNHHRCVRCYSLKTRSERDIDTVTFLPHTVPLPRMNIDTYLRQAATDIVQLLKKTPNIAFPTLQAGDKTYNAISKLAVLLQRIETFPPISSPQSHTDVLTTNDSPSFKPPTVSPVLSSPAATPSLPRVQ